LDPGGGLEQTLEDATAVGHPPHTFKAKVEPALKGTGLVVNLTWKKPFGDVLSYRVYRVDGAVVNVTSFSRKTLVAQTPETSAIDDRATKGKTYTYFATVRLIDNTESGMSNASTVTVTVP
jgi:fibronectin type 3 domain-containing protein